MRDYFYAVSIKRHPLYHEKFADCLRLMRPGDYEVRWQHLFIANQIEEALTYYALAVLDARRQLAVPQKVGQLEKASGWEDVTTYLEKMSQARAAYDRDKISEGIAILEEIESFLPELLIAERDYLEAQLRLKSHLLSEFERAVALLERWQGLKDRESEVWSRIAQLLMVALAQSNRQNEAIQIEELLTKDFWTRRKVDPWALYGLNCLRRRSECVHHLPVARGRLEKALLYFGTPDPEAMPRHPLQYYFTLTNLIANLLVSGEYEASNEQARSLEQTVQRHPSFPWPALEVPANNYVLASYLNGELTVERAVDLIQQLPNERTGLGDLILIRNNYALFLIHAGNVQPARQILEEMYAGLRRDEKCDAYHKYFVGNNLAALLVANDELDRSLDILREIGAGLVQFYPAIKQTMIQRHELLLSVLSTNLGAMTPPEFDRILEERFLPQIGRQWAFYGRGFLFSDIQFWSAS